VTVTREEALEIFARRRARVKFAILARIKQNLHRFANVFFVLLFVVLPIITTLEKKGAVK